MADLMADLCHPGPRWIPCSGNWETGPWRKIPWSPMIFAVPCGRSLVLKWWKIPWKNPKNPWNGDEMMMKWCKKRKVPKVSTAKAEVTHFQADSYPVFDICLCHMLRCFEKKISSVSEVAKKSLNVVPHWCDVFLSGHVWVVRGRRDVGMVQNVLAQNGWFRP